MLGDTQWRLACTDTGDCHFERRRFDAERGLSANGCNVDLHLPVKRTFPRWNCLRPISSPDGVEDNVSRRVKRRNCARLAHNGPHNPGDRPGTEVVSSPEISETPIGDVSQTQETADQPSEDTAPVTNDNHSSVNDGSEDSRATTARAAKDVESEDDTSTNTTVQYVVAVFTVRPRWLSKHPDAAKFRIHVLSKKKFDQIAEGGDIKDILKTKYDHWMEDEGIEECETKLAAWEAAIEKSKGLSKERSPFDLKRGEKNRRVYVFEMNPTVIEASSTFRKMNENVLSKNQEPQCVYVGETVLIPRKRYKAHRSKKRKSRTSTRWGREFFLPTFKEAYCKDLLLEFQETHTKHSTESWHCGNGFKTKRALLHTAIDPTALDSRPPSYGMLNQLSRCPLPDTAKVA